MARGNRVVVSTDPKGRFVEGIVGTGLTFKPGMCIERDLTVALAHGRWTWKYATPGTNGNRSKGPITIVTEDIKIGRTTSDAYTAGETFQAYVPLPGDEINVLLKDVAGTGDDHTIGELLMVETGSGKWLATTGSPQSTPFELLETVTDPVADTLAWAVFGNS